MQLERRHAASCLHPRVGRLRRWLLTTACAALLWPAGALALDIDEARHLLTRTGFGAAPSEVAALLPLSREAAVDALLDGLRAQPSLPLPVLPGAARNRPVRLETTDASAVHATLLQQWWLAEMISTPSPMTERMVLFWHGLLTSKADARGLVWPMYDQLSLFRGKGTDNFRVLLRGLVRDPMMLVYLDNIDNTRAHANENLARELMELFTLGPGHYEEDDVKALSRVLTGHRVDDRRGAVYEFSAVDHDDTPVTLLGHDGVTGIDQALDILLAQPAAPVHLARRLALEFISVAPNEAEVQRLAGLLRQHDYALRPVLRALFTGDAFWSASARAALAKSPIDLVVGFARSFGITGPDAYSLVYYCTALGQEPLAPPNVAGWPGGTQWITAAQMSRQWQVVQRMWSWYEQSRRMPTSMNQGLSVRVSSESGPTPTRLRLWVDGHIVATETLRGGLDYRRESASDSVGYIKPAWQTLHVPAARLTRRPRSVAVEHLPPNGEGESNLFVNWIEVDGQRFTPRHARQLPARKCKDPHGMLYCYGRLVFDLPLLRRRQAAPGFLDREARLESNETIEYLPSLVTPPLRSAGYSDEVLRREAVDEWQHLLPQGQPEQWRSFVLPVPPFRPVPKADITAPMAQAVSWTLDPAYLLK